MLKLRLNCKLRSYCPLFEYDVDEDVLNSTLDELYVELQEGALLSIDVEGAEGGSFRLKLRR